MAEVQKFQIGQHDTLPPLRAQLVDADGKHPNLGGNVSVVFQMGNKKNPDKVEEPADIINDSPDPDPDAATVEFAGWTADHTDTPGLYFGAFRVVFEDGGIETFPNGENEEKIQITVTHGVPNPETNP